MYLLWPLGLEIMKFKRSHFRCSLKYYFNSLWPGDAMWYRRTLSTLVQSNGLLPDGFKPLSEPLLTYRQRHPLASIPGRCLLDYPRYQSPSYIWNLHIWNHNRIHRGRWRTGWQCTLEIPSLYWNVRLLTVFLLSIRIPSWCSVSSVYIK